MGHTTAAPKMTPHSIKGGGGLTPSLDSSNQRSQFVIMALNMSWQLALAVLIPVVAGVQLDKLLDTSFVTFVGLAVAFIASAVVMWRTMQAANKLPVPKLSAAQKRAIKKSYEDEDDD